MWEQARAWLDDEQAEVDSIQAEVDRWTELKNKELDLELWRDYDKGAKGLKADSQKLSLSEMRHRLLSRPRIAPSK